MYPDHYAPRYIEFKEVDCVRLCKKCHEKINQIERNYIKNLGFWDIWNSIFNSPVTEKGPMQSFLAFRFLEEHRLKIIQKCNNWLKRKKNKRNLTKR